jgi:hypothetical protein
MHRLLGLATCICLAVSTAGCSAGGQAWVHGAADPGSAREAASAQRQSTLPPERDGAPISWRREVITLGECVEVPEDSSAVPQADAPAAVSYVTNNYYPNYGYGYGYGYGFGVWAGGGHRPDRPDRPDHRPPAPSEPQTPRVGGDWAAPPSYGPPMMTQTAPADPWR